mmetsp:Transcript_3578/g.4879  ORF Transcript_3578/g.4879 Transcript_3578/m.4879 type:complete len:106 (-) Transcript_3578:50-367(-)
MKSENKTKSSSGERCVCKRKIQELMVLAHGQMVHSTNSKVLVSRLIDVATSQKDWIVNSKVSPNDRQAPTCRPMSLRQRHPFCSRDASPLRKLWQHPTTTSVTGR